MPVEAMPESQQLNLEVQRSLGRVEGKLDYLLTRLTDHFNSDEDNFEELSRRMSGVEKKVYIFSGIFALMGTLFSVLGSHFFFWKT